MRPILSVGAVTTIADSPWAEAIQLHFVRLFCRIFSFEIHFPTLFRHSTYHTWELNTLVTTRNLDAERGINHTTRSGSCHGSSMPYFYACISPPKTKLRWTYSCSEVAVVMVEKRQCVFDVCLSVHRCISVDKKTN